MTRQKGFLSDDIIDKAIGVFMAKGYQRTTVKDLVDATGLHPGSLYNAFGRKQEIYQAALDRFDAISPFNQLLALADTAPPRETIEKLLAGVVAPDTAAGEFRGCLITYAAAEVGDRDGELAERLRAAFGRMEDGICRLIARGQACGDFASTRDARELARHLLSTIQGLQVLATVEPDRSRLRAVADIALRSLDSDTL